ncbi:MAG: glutathione S-transferase N-terminal domain-containing protein [Pseudomonadales bacterium]|nr:glutathione S-transferase N-terminal domain-containing protein [Pseudomonadales bacterium]
MGMFNIATSFAVSVARLGAGMNAAKADIHTDKEPLIVYEFEACPYCRKVREALTELNLDAEIRPCPKKGTRFRPALAQQAGKEQFPYLMDPNTGWEGYESTDIVKYLFNTYGNGRRPGILIGGNPLAIVNGTFSSALRPTYGWQHQASNAPDKLLELYSFEASPFCRIVREKLCELEIPYLLHNVGKGSPSRPAFIERSGKMMVPYLVDPNTDTEMFESADIIQYLEDTYSAK